MSPNINHIVSAINHSLKKRKSTCVYRKSKLSVDLTDVIFRAGYIAIWVPSTLNGKSVVVVYFKFSPTFTSLTRVKAISNPGKRVYITYDSLKESISSTGMFYILSTSTGLITGTEALKLKIGGEVILEGSH